MTAAAPPPSCLAKPHQPRRAGLGALAIADLGSSASRCAGRRVRSSEDASAATYRRGINPPDERTDVERALEGRCRRLGRTCGLTGGLCPTLDNRGTG